MAEHQSNMNFRLMALEFKLRDAMRPRMEILMKVGVKPGFTVLDFGCGPGSYIPGLEELVRETGKVFALDVQPVAVQMVKSMASKKGWKNVETILSDCKTGLPDAVVDVVLLYDILHGLSDPGGVLGEIARVLKPDGVLSLSDHHLTEDEIVSRVTAGGLFKVSQKGVKTIGFNKT